MIYREEFLRTNLCNMHIDDSFKRQSNNMLSMARDTDVAPLGDSSEVAQVDRASAVAGLVIFSVTPHSGTKRT